jgi:phosphopantothenoylcysteine decarboxylase/phosphopantothenate--cysteine ligase
MAGKPKDVLAGSRVLVGVTGGIAAFKTAAMVSTLVQRGAAVQTMMTEAAAKFVTPLTFQALTRQPVYLTLWSSTEDFRTSHIALGEWAQACVIAPATADIIGKMAHGLADEIVSTTVLALDCPVLVAPAMNSRMWEKKVVQDNVARLATAGYRFVGPAEGRLACGTTGPGRMSDPEQIIAALEAILSERRGKK